VFRRSMERPRAPRFRRSLRPRSATTRSADTERLGVEFTYNAESRRLERSRTRPTRPLDAAYRYL
jgi:hypothetical protein